MSQNEEKRIYVVVADTVQITHGDWYVKSVDQVAGRIAAQVGHVVSKMRVTRAHKYDEVFTPITTIVLAARDSKELDHICYCLALAGERFEVFHDVNEDVYGRVSNDDNGLITEPATVKTALATHPVAPASVAPLLGHLPLWTPKGSGGN
jgi:hypothetical protein